MKKQITPETAKKRLMIIFVIIGVMVLFIFYARITTPKDRPMHEWEIIEQKMDEQLDSLVTDFFKDTVEVVSTGDYEILTNDIESDKRERYIKIRRQYLEEHSAYETLPSDKEIGKEYDKMNKGSEKAKPETAYFRAVRFKDSDGGIYTGYQRSDMDLKTSYLVLILKNKDTEDQAQAEAVEKMKTDSENNK